jgi:CheY-like chemotaxis protein
MQDKNKPTIKSDKKILVIEGDFINSFMLKQFLEDDFKMLYARDSHEVVKIMNEHFVDLVLLNAEYDSFGLSVADLVKYIKNRDATHQIKIVALPNHQNETNNVEMSFDASLSHPYTKDEVVKNIAKLLNN